MPIGRSSGYLPAIGDGFSALDARASRDKLDGFAVVNGLGVSVSSGLTLSIASGTATVGESSGTVQTVSLGSSTTVTLNSADSTDPRKDTIYIDTSGNIQAEQGTAEAAQPSGNDRFTTYQPEPPLPSTEGTILAEVWVGAGVTSLQSADIRDHRYPADIVADDVFSQAVTTADVLNSDIGDSVDYADPRWIAESDATVDLNSFQSLDRTDQTTGGSGSISIGFFTGLKLSTGTTSGSDARAHFGGAFINSEQWFGSSEPTFNRDQIFAAGVHFADTQGPLYAVSGSVNEGGLTAQHIGFGMKSGDLVGTVADGSTENTATLTSGASAGVFKLRAVYDQSAGTVDFFVDGTNEGSVSSNLPSGQTQAFKTTFLALNSTTTDRVLECAGYEKVIAP